MTMQHMTKTNKLRHLGVCWFPIIATLQTNMNITSGDFLGTHKISVCGHTGCFQVYSQDTDLQRHYTAAHPDESMESFPSNLFYETTSQTHPAAGVVTSTLTQSKGSREDLSDLRYAHVNQTLAPVETRMTLGSLWLEKYTKETAKGVRTGKLAHLQTKQARLALPKMFEEIAVPIMAQFSDMPRRQFCGAYERCLHEMRLEIALATRRPISEIYGPRKFMTQAELARHLAEQARRKAMVETIETAEQVRLAVRLYHIAI
jgi:hypothetical protein